jgi:hypothetical protein
MFVPYSLRRLEQRILEELRNKRLTVYFEIKNYDPQTEVIAYNLAHIDPKQEPPAKAKAIVKMHIEKWKKTYVSI